MTHGLRSRGPTSNVIAAHARYRAAKCGAFRVWYRRVRRLCIETHGIDPEKTTLPVMWLDDFLDGLSFVAAVWKAYGTPAQAEEEEGDFWS